MYASTGFSCASLTSQLLRTSSAKCSWTFGVRPEDSRADPRLRPGFWRLPAGNNPEVTLQNRQKTEIVLKCLTGLSPAHREVIDLVYYHEKSIDEVAEITQVPQNTVNTRMFYARKRLAELMAAQGIGRAIV